MKTTKHLTMEELSLLLGINERTIKQLVKTRQLPCTYVQRRPFFDFDVLLRHFRRLEGGAA